MFVLKGDFILSYIDIVLLSCKTSILVMPWNNSLFNSSL